ncbi:MAG: DUF4468 domain-containing protein [Dysgonamonadaceae bacterium]|nr:DUF4468 domain-containing protein [Dysgonamonadaceae bacterium]
MKRKVYVLLLSLIVLFCSNSLPVFSKSDSIPLVNGKITFMENINANLTQKEIHDRILDYVNNDLKPVEGFVAMDKPDRIVCNLTDYIEISKQMMQTFAMYMNYTATFLFNDSVCSMKVSNITFMEKEAFDKQKQWEKNPDNVLNYPKSNSILQPIYSAEQIFLDKAYSLTFYRKASQRIAKASVYRIEEVIEEIVDALTLTEKELNLVKRRVNRAQNK